MKFRLLSKLSLGIRFAAFAALALAGGRLVGAGCADEGISLPLSDLHVRTKQLDREACLAFFHVPKSGNKRYRRQTTNYLYDLDLTKEYTDQWGGVHRDKVRFHREYTVEETLRNDTSGIIDIVFRNGSGNGALQWAGRGQNGEFNTTEKGNFEFQQTQGPSTQAAGSYQGVNSSLGIDGTYHRSSLDCWEQWVTTEEPYTYIWPGHFPTGGFSAPVTTGTVNSSTEVSTYQLGQGESGSGTIKITKRLSKKDTFEDALGRLPPLPEEDWVDHGNHLEAAQWGLPSHEADVTCIPNGTICQVEVELKLCAADYKATLWVFSKDYPDPNGTAPWSTTAKEVREKFTITEEEAAAGKKITFKLPAEKGKFYKVDLSRGIVVKRLLPGGDAGRASCRGPRMHSAHFDLCLGRTATGENAGYIGFHAEQLGQSSFAASALRVDLFNDDGTVELVKVNDVVREIYALDADVKIDDLAGGGYEVKFYAPGPVGNKFVNLTSSWRFKPVTPGNYSQIEIKCTFGGGETYVFGQSGSAWTLNRDGLAIEELDESVPNQETRLIKDPAQGNAVVSRERTIYDIGTKGQKRKTQHIRYADLNTPAETTTWAYLPGTDRLDYIENSDGSWRRYTYDTAGRVVLEISPWRDSLRSDTNLASHRYTETLRDSITISGKSVERETRIERILGQEVGRSYKLVWVDDVDVAFGQYPSGQTKKSRQIWEIEARAPGLAWDAVGNRITKSYYDTIDGTLWRSEQPDGRIMEVSDWAISDGGRATRTMSWGGGDIATIVYSETNASEHVVFEEVTDTVLEDNDYMRSIGYEHYIPEEARGLTSNRVFSSKTATEFTGSDPVRGRPTMFNYLDGTYETTEYACCGRVTRQVDRSRVETNYYYDVRGRLVEQNSAIYAVCSGQNYLGSSYYEYDAADRMIKTGKGSLNGYRATVAETEYDLAGRVKKTTDENDRQTTYAYGTAAGGGRVETVTRLTDGATTVSSYHRDGQMISRSGTAVHPVKYLYGVNAQGQRWWQEIRLGANSSENEWVKTYTDMLGRLVKEEYPDGAASTYTYTRDTTPSAHPGDYVKVDPDGFSTYGYGITFWYEVTLKTVEPPYEPSYTVWVLKKGHNDGTVSEVSFDGRHRWFTDLNQRTTYQRTDDDDFMYSRIVTTVHPEGHSSVQRYRGPLVVEESKYDDQGASVSEVGYDYDDFGRLVAVYGAESTFYSYLGDGRIETVVTPTGSTTYGYNNLGLVETVTGPEGTRSYSYWPTGEVKRTSGGSGYPSEYTYDTQGRMKTLTTWKDFASQAGAAVTTWNYHPQRGWLTSKTYAGNTAGPSYTYWPSGKLKTRTWARGVKTSYTYNPMGSLLTVTYDDGLTPSVTYTYLADGKTLNTREDAAGKVTLGYAASTKTVSGESYVGGLLGGVALDHRIDALKRKGGARATVGGAQQLLIQWQYDEVSRLQSITQDQTSATLSYQSYQGALAGISVTQAGVLRLGTQRTLGPGGRIDAVAFDNPSPGVVGSRAYTYDAANRRTAIEQENSQRWVYDYDPLGQVNSAQKGFRPSGTGAWAPLQGYAFAFQHDDIGNRKSATANNRSSTYTSDLLNRYLARGTPLWVDVRGEAAANATVLVNDEPTSRSGEQFYGAVPVLGAKENMIKIQAATASPHYVVTENRAVLVPTVPESFQYDADGNLTQDGLWNYEWDGENRLKAQELRSDVGAPVWKRLEYAYDGQGRRIRKVVKTKTSATGPWATASDTRFLYDGWNLLAEFNYSAGAFALARSHAWGIDLSGSSQGAGGVGGLLWTKVAATAKAYAAGSDANGNVVVYVDCADGTVAGRRDYGAFGEPVLTIGVAGSLPFGFSTKYEEKESGLYYYGFRYYNPSTGRWPSRDPIGEEGGLNLYSMVGNNPVSRYDILGLYAGFTIRRYNGGLGHQFISRGGVNIGFYGDAAFGTPGGFMNEQDVTDGTPGRPSPNDDNFYYEWDTNKKTSGTFKAGSKKGCPCKSGNEEDVVSCMSTFVQEASQGDIAFNIVLRNCRVMSNRALTSCCLKKGKLIHTPPKGSKTSAGRSSDDSGGASDISTGE